MIPQLRAQPPQMAPGMQPPMQGMQQPAPSQSPAIGQNLQEVVRRLSNPAIQTQQLYALSKDPNIGFLAATELRMRNQRRAAMQNAMAQAQPGTVVDRQAQEAMAADSAGIMNGVPQMPVQRFADGGPVTSFGGKAKLYQAADELSRRLGIPFSAAMEIVKQRGWKTFDDMVNENGVRASVVDADRMLERTPATLGEIFKQPDAAAQAAARFSAPAAGAPARSTGGMGISSLGIPPFKPLDKETPMPEALTPAANARVAADRAKIIEGMKANLPAEYTPEQRLARQQAELANVNKLNPLDPEYNAQMQRMKEVLAKVEGNEPTNRRNAWVTAGLGMLASESPFFGVGIGKGGLKGMEQYTAAQSADQKRADLLNAAYLDAVKGRMSHTSGNVNTALGQYREALAREDARKSAQQQLAGVNLTETGIPAALANQTLNAQNTLYGIDKNRLGMQNAAGEYAMKVADTVSSRMKAEAAKTAAAGGGSTEDSTKFMEVYRKALANVEDQYKNDPLKTVQLRKLAGNDPAKLNELKITAALRDIVGLYPPGSPMHNYARRALEARTGSTGAGTQSMSGFVGAPPGALIRQ